LKQTDGLGRTIFYHAVLAKRDDLIDFLLSKNCNVNIVATSPSYQYYCASILYVALDQDLPFSNYRKISSGRR